MYPTSGRGWLRDSSRERSEFTTQSTPENDGPKVSSYLSRPVRSGRVKWKKGPHGPPVLTQDLTPSEYVPRVEGGSSRVVDMEKRQLGVTEEILVYDPYVIRRITGS